MRAKGCGTNSNCCEKIDAISLLVAILPQVVDV